MGGVRRIPDESKAGNMLNIYTGIKNYSALTPSKRNEAFHISQLLVILTCVRYSLNTFFPFLLICSGLLCVFLFRTRALLECSL